jgi:hypothetical protein
MRRLHLIEIMDQKWCPSNIRDGITDFLRWFEHFTNIYHPIFPRLKRVLLEFRSERIVDLCSGSGGPWVSLYSDFNYLKEYEPTVLLTDIYPNVPAFEASKSLPAGKIVFYPEPVSATNVPKDLTGFRTMFSAFHHFPPQGARSILADAVRNKQAIAICEITQRHPLIILTVCFLPFLVLLATPFIKPFHLWRLLWTYLIPVIPFAFMCDAIVSCLRTYSCKELCELTERVAGGDAYYWEIGIEPLGHPAIGITYLIGYPTPEKQTKCTET